MELELRRETLRRWDALCRVHLEQEETMEAIVPDALPDIWQVLEGRGTFLLQRKEPLEGKGEMAGLLKVTVLYQPEGNGVETMEVTLPVSVSPELKGVNRRSVLQAEPRVLGVDVHLLNPRKVLVRVGWAMEVTGYGSESVQLPAMVEEGHGVRQRTGSFAGLVTVGVQEKAFTYRDTLSLPAGRPAVEKVLAARGDLVCAEARVIGTKLVFKGEATVTALVRGEDGSIFQEVFPIPYSQLMDAGEDSEEALCRVVLLFTDMKCAPDPEDAHGLLTELAVLAQGTLERELELPLLADLYSTTHRLTVEEAPVGVTDLLCRGEGQETLRASLAAQEAVREVLDLRAVPGRLSQRADGEDAVLGLEVLCTALVVTDEGPAALEGRLLAEHRVPGQGAVALLAEGSLLRAPTAAVTGDGVEVTLPLAFRWTGRRDRQVACIQSVALGEPWEESGDRPSLRLRAVRPGESLWDVAKSCLSTEADILAASGLAAGEVTAGQMVVVPRG